jgi:hypothetical protein
MLNHLETRANKIKKLKTGFNSCVLLFLSPKTTLLYHMYYRSVRGEGNYVHTIILEILAERETEQEL